MPNDAFFAFEDLWSRAGCEPAVLERVTLTGEDPILPTDFKIGTAASAVIAASALAATEIWRLRTGRGQSVAVDLRAAVAAFRSERYLRAESQPSLHDRDPVFGFYEASDGRWIQIHSNLPHHRAGALKLLGCEGTREAVAAAVAKWTAGDLEDAFAAAGLPTGMVRSGAEWRAHPQGQAVASLPLFEIIKIGEAPPELSPGAGPRALGGLRVLDFTRVIAGPVCGRTLAAYGADVLLVSAKHLPNLPGLVIDTGLGKLSTSLDVRQAGDADRLRSLVRDCDVFCQSYRPGALARLGLGPEDLARLRPGIVYVTLSAFGHAGPWHDRRGFETIIQSVSGMAHEQGMAAGAEGPRHLPAQVVDHGTGYLAAFGALVALARRAREGGSYLVRVSLAQTGRWVDGLGRVEGRATRELTLEAVQDLLEDMDSPFGRLRHVRPAARLSETPAFWSRPVVPLGTHPAAWPA